MSTVLHTSYSINDFSIRSHLHRHRNFTAFTMPLIQDVSIDKLLTNIATIDLMKFCPPQTSHSTCCNMYFNDKECLGMVTNLKCPFLAISLPPIY